MKFTVVLHTDDGLNYGVTVPDLPGCFSGGNSLDDALLSVTEAIDIHVESLLEDSADIPEQQSITAHKSNPDYADGIWAVVDVAVEKYFGPAEKINITVPRRMLARIDEHARKHNMSRSGFLVDASSAAMRRE